MTVSQDKEKKEIGCLRYHEAYNFVPIGFIDYMKMCWALGILVGVGLKAVP